MHREVSDAQGSVWWDKFGNSASTAMRERRLAAVRDQLAAGIPTYAFLYRQGETWRTRLEEVTVDPEDVDDERRPAYYAKDDCNLFVRVSDFQLFPTTWISEHLLLASYPDPAALAGALGNQANPLLMYHGGRPSDRSPALPRQHLSSPS